jgi:hypothetical protein
MPNSRQEKYLKISANTHETSFDVVVVVVAPDKLIKLSHHKMELIKIEAENEIKLKLPLIRPHWRVAH